MESFKQLWVRGIVRRLMVSFAWVALILWAAASWFGVLVENTFNSEVVSWVLKAGIPLRFVGFQICMTWFAVFLALLIVPPILWIRFSARKRSAKDAAEAPPPSWSESS